MAYKVGMISLGCPKNQVDAERMLAALRQELARLQGSTAPTDAVDPGGA